jgi:hypothetical protein
MARPSPILTKFEFKCSTVVEHMTLNPISQGFEFRCKRRGIENNEKIAKSFIFQIVFNTVSLVNEFDQCRRCLVSLQL